MKTKFFKTGLPIMAFLMAIGLAFATEKSSINESALVKGYIHQNNTCVEVFVDCDPAGMSLCTIGGLTPVFEGDKTSCPVQMRDWQ